MMENKSITGEGRDLIEELSWEVARNVIDNHKRCYSKIFEAAPITFSISLRNSIYNQIQSAIKCHTDKEIAEWIAKSEEHRKTMRKIKRAKTIKDLMECE